MGSRPTAGRWAVAGVCAVIATALAAEPAAAGEYAVANCKADRLNFSTRAFESFAHRGMKIRRACNPEGPGLRGLITTNIIHDGRVQAGSVATVTISAPPGTRFTSFRWAGTARRRDCSYALQLYAAAPDRDPIVMKNVRAHQHCPRPLSAQAAGWIPETFNVAGATRIVQRTVCVGDRGDGTRSCSARGANYIRTHLAEVWIADTVAPTAGIIGDTPLARGEWVGGMQPLNYDANDNVGVRGAHVNASGQSEGFDERPCTFAAPEEFYADRVPCPNGPGQIDVDTERFPEGTQALIVQARDPAGNVGDSAAVSARIDNTPPGRVDVSVEGGQEWRSRNDFAVAWPNAPEIDRAPIAAASYKLCAVGGGSCDRGEQSGSDIARFGVQVPAPGEWTLSLWRRDAAGNQTEDVASVPVTLRYDPDPPQVAFESSSAADPTLVAVQAADKVSGLAQGAIEIGPSGSGTWHALPTRLDGSRLLARIDDAALPPGAYMLRARAVDKARNEASSDRRLDGQAMALTLPVRRASTMQAGFERMRAARRTVGGDGKRRRVRRPETVLEPAARVRSGGRARVAGRLVDSDGRGIAGAEVRVLSSSPIAPERLVAVLETDGHGRYRYRATGSTNRTLRFAYAGSALVLPAERTVTMTVPARTSLPVSRRRVLNGQAVTFDGRVRTLPIPPGGKLVELQVRLSGRWQTFRTTRTDEAGRWAIRYRFTRTRGVQWYRFRARLPPEANYPFAAGGSRTQAVQVRGQ